MQTTTLSSKFQISIPKKVREQLHLKAGQQFLFVIKGSTLMLVPKRGINEIKGILVGVSTKDYRDRKDRI